jgi:hypothetical protein
LGKLTADYDAALGKAALAAGAVGGAADAKAAAETTLENAAYILARALASHFKKTSDLTSLGKVDIAKRGLQRLRNQDLIARTTEIRDLAVIAQAQPNAADRGVTATRSTALSDAISAFTAQNAKPRGQIVNRSALLKELETDTADLLHQAHDFDDLVLQFDDTDEGRRFITAWHRARHVVENGHGHTIEEPTTTPPPAASATNP